MPKSYADHTDAAASIFGPAIDAELAVLASIEARFWDELRNLEFSGNPASKVHLRQQLEERRRIAREPHVLRLANLQEEALMRTMFRSTKH
jgi:hypothetical protein